MPIFRGAQEVIRRYRGEREICRTYRGPSNTPFYERAQEPWEYEATFPIGTASLTRTGPFRAVDWNATQAAWTRKDDINPRMLQSPVSGRAYGIQRLRIQEGLSTAPMLQQGVRVILYVGVQPATLPLTGGYPSGAGDRPRLLESVERIVGGAFALWLGADRYRMGGPNASNVTRADDLGDGFYTWQPRGRFADYFGRTDTMKALIDGILDGSLTGTLTLRIRGPNEPPASITRWVATAGQVAAAANPLTLDDEDITAQGLDITINGTLADTTRYHVDRVIDGRTARMAESPDDRLNPPTGVSVVDRLTPDLKPRYSGWHYNLAAYNSWLGACGTVHATCVVRVITPPTITSFTDHDHGQHATGANDRFAWLQWVASEGDTGGNTWSMEYLSGRRPRSIPTGRHLSAAQGAQTGLHRTRIQVPATGAATTRLRLRVSYADRTNATVNVDRELAITW